MSFFWFHMKLRRLTLYRNYLAVITSPNCSLRLSLFMRFPPYDTKKSFCFFLFVISVIVILSSVIVNCADSMEAMGTFHFIFLNSTVRFFLSKSASTLNIQIIVNTMKRLCIMK